MMLTLTIIHVVISVALVLVVLLQHGKQQGLSGSIAGGAETFFGKNKGRTIDAMLKKFTAVIAILFVVSSISLAAVAINTYNKENEAIQSQSETQNAGDFSINENGELVDANGNVLGSDENGNIVDAEGNIVISAEEIAAAQEGEAATGENTEGEATPTPAE